MKSISVALDTHLQGATTSLATCWKCTRTDGQIFGFCDHDKNLTVSGQLYKASTGYSRSAIQANASLSVDNLDLQGVLADDSIQDTDILAGLWDYAQVEIFMVNWADLTQGTLKQLKGRLGEVRSGKTMFTAELRGLTQQLQQNAGRLITLSCDANFTDARCGLNPAPYTTGGAVSGVTSNRIFVDSGRTEPAGHFDAGHLVWNSGNNIGLSSMIKSYVLSGTIMMLQVPTPYPIQIGDTYTALAGCLKRFTEDCSARFNNTVNFRGFPHVPGLDLVLSGHEN